MEKGYRPSSLAHASVPFIAQRAVPDPRVARLTRQVAKAGKTAVGVVHFMHIVSRSIITLTRQGIRGTTGWNGQTLEYDIETGRCGRLCKVTQRINDRGRRN